MDTFDELREAARAALESRRLPAPSVLRALRKEAGVTQRTLAEAVGVSHTAIGLYEAGRRRPSGGHLRRYLEALRVPPRGGGGMKDRAELVQDARGATDRGDRLLTTEELAEYLQVPVATTYQWRYRHEGPPGCRVGKYVRYRMATSRHGSTGRRPKSEVSERCDSPRSRRRAGNREPTGRGPRPQPLGSRGLPAGI
jgi:transcriptional regulator with XRE-family HTH domain